MSCIVQTSVVLHGDHLDVRMIQNVSPTGKDVMDINIVLTEVMSSTVLTSVLQRDPSDVRVRRDVSPATVDVMDLVIALTKVMSGSTVLDNGGRL